MTIEIEKEVVKISREVIKLIEDKWPICAMVIYEKRYRDSYQNTNIEEIQQVYIVENSCQKTMTNPNITRYNSPAGQIAATSIGDEINIRFPTIGNHLELAKCNVTQKNTFTPKMKEQDAVGRFFFENDIEINKNSLRELIKDTLNMVIDDQNLSSVKPNVNISEEELEKLLNQTYETLNTNVTKNEILKRDIIKGMKLRFIPILDKLQDSIMRDSPYIPTMLNGPAGTGKSTTMIKKLSKNLDKDYSDIESDDKSWYMFTPTELLKGYLKEVFNRDGVPAPDENVFIWKSLSKELGNRCGILKNLSEDEINNKKFSLSDQDFIKNVKAQNLIYIFEDFYKYQQGLFVSKFKEELLKVLNLNIGSLEIFRDSLIQIEDLNSNILKKLDDLTNIIKIKYEEFERDISSEILKYFTVTFFQNKTLDEIKDFLLGTYNTVYAMHEKDQGKVWKHIIDAVKEYVNKNRKIVQSNKYSQIIRKLDFDEKISDELISKISKISNNIDSIKWFMKPVINKYIDTTILYYKNYRKEHSDLFVDNLNDNEISQHELDMLILTCQKKYKLCDLKKLDDYIRTQVFVDEITDFSPIQLAVMYNLMPEQKVFFGAGDYNQSLTAYGVKSLDVLKWAIKDCRQIDVSTIYRQSKQLSDFAQHFMSNKQQNILHPEYLDLEGLNPVYKCGLNDGESIVKWLKERLIEIKKRINGDITPSIAIIVDTESQIEPISRQLNKELREYNIEVEPCIKGKILGNKSDIRVFSIDYIKGLEFEAVFFINVDSMIKNKGDLFKSYLYVGVSRAATFLGMTFKQDTIPNELECVKNLFIETWTE